MASVTFNQFSAKTSKAFDQLVRKTLIDLDRKLDERSPVGDAKYWLSLNPVTVLTTKTGKSRKNPKQTTMLKPPKGYAGGRFRGNWQYGFGSRPSGELDVTDKTGSATTTRINAGIEAAPTIGVHFLTNNVPYAQRIENGWSRQAPAGVVGLAVLDFEGIVSRVAVEVSK